VSWPFNASNSRAWQCHFDSGPFWACKGEGAVIYARH